MDTLPNTIVYGVFTLSFVLRVASLCLSVALHNPKHLSSTDVQLFSCLIRLKSLYSQLVVFQDYIAA